MSHLRSPLAPCPMLAVLALVNACAADDGPTAPSPDVAVSAQSICGSSGSVWRIERVLPPAAEGQTPDCTFACGAVHQDGELCVDDDECESGVCYLTDLPPQCRYAPPSDGGPFKPIVKFNKIGRCVATRRVSLPNVTIKFDAVPGETACDRDERCGVDEPRLVCRPKAPYPDAFSGQDDWYFSWELPWVCAFREGWGGACNRDEDCADGTRCSHPVQSSPFLFIFEVFNPGRCQ